MKKIQILGGGCKKCNDLAAAANEAATQLGIEFEIEKVTDMNEISGFGVMFTPAMVVDGDVKVSGKVPSVDKLKDLISAS